jgi:single-stranded-DNA-specific exonuclease
MNWAEQLHSDNFDRKEADANITQEALALIAADEVLINKMSTVVFQPHWHKGVVGIVASRLIEHYYRPTIVLTQSGEYVGGSARSVIGFNVYEAIHQCKDLLLGYGGHFFAAGMTMENDKVEAFCQRFEEVVSASIHPDLLIPQLFIDTEICFKDITLAFFNIIDQMEPFGPGNLNPVFISKKVTNTGYSKLIKDKHIRFVLKQDDIIISGIGFDMADKMLVVSSRQPLDIVYKIDENEWNGERSLQLKIIDVRLAQESDI